jgi:hypothetical protein
MQKEVLRQAFLSSDLPFWENCLEGKLWVLTLTSQAVLSCSAEKLLRTSNTATLVPWRVCWGSIPLQWVLLVIVDTWGPESGPMWQMEMAT